VKSIDSVFLHLYASVIHYFAGIVDISRSLSALSASQPITAYHEESYRLDTEVEEIRNPVS
jgi:hypothetical protein